MVYTVKYFAGFTIAYSPTLPQYLIMGQQQAEYKQVTVMCYGHKEARLIVVRDLGDVIEVCSRDEIEDARRQNREPLTVGFRRESVAKWE